MFTRVKVPKNSDFEYLLNEKGTETVKVSKHITVSDKETTTGHVRAEKKVLTVDGTMATPIGYKTSFYVEDSAGNNEEVAIHAVVLTTDTNGSESAEHQFWCKRAGTMTKILTIDGAATVTADGNLSFTAARTVTILDNTDNAWSVIDSGGTPLTYIEFDSRDAAPLILISQHVHLANNMDILPVTAGGNDLGSTSKEWGDIFIADNKSVKFGDGQDMALSWDASNLVLTSVAANTGALVLGVSGEGIDLQLFGATTGYDVLWDESADTMIFNDGAKLQLGTTGGCATLSAATTTLTLLPVTDNNTFTIGDATHGFDLKIFGADASHYITLDASANAVKFEDSTFLDFGTNTAGVGTRGDFQLGFDATQLNLLAAANNAIFKIGDGTASVDTWKYGSSTSHVVSWDASANVQKYEDGDELHFGTNLGVGPGNVGDVQMRWDGTDFDILAAANNSVIKIGNGTASFDFWLYGASTAAYISWDASANDLKLEDSVSVMFGTGAGAGPGNAGDVELRWDGTDLDLLAAANNTIFKIGDGTTSFDVWLFGSAAANYISWDASANDLKCEDSVSIMFGTGAGAGPGTAGDVEMRWDGTDFDILAAANNSIIKIGNGTNSFDLWLYGSAAGNYVSWDASANSVKLEDNVVFGFGTNTAGPGTLGDINITFNGTKLLVAQTTADTDIDWGVDGAGINHKFYGDTASVYMYWDQTNDGLLFADNAKLIVGTGSDDTISHNGTNTLWTHTTGDLTIDNTLVTGSTIMLLGTDTTATDFQVQNNSAAALLTVTPGSATGGTVVASGLCAKSDTAAAITGVTTISARDSGGVFSVAKTGAYAITLPTPAQGLTFTFMVLDTGANAVTISNGSAHLYGALNINNTLTAATGTTITLAASGSVGDWVKFQGIDATHYLVTGACIAAGDITVA